MNEVLARIIARVTDRLAKDRDVEVLNSIIGRAVYWLLVPATGKDLLLKHINKIEKSYELQ